MLSEAELEAHVASYDERLVQVCGLRSGGLPGTRRPGEGPYLGIDGDRYFHGWIERGQDTRRFYDDLDDLLYEVLAWPVRQHAYHRSLADADADSDADPRRVEYARRVEWLGALEPEWGVREQVVVDEEVAKRPFEDMLPRPAPDVPLEEAIAAYSARMEARRGDPVVHDPELLATLRAENPDREDLLFRYFSSRARVQFDQRVAEENFPPSVWGMFWASWMSVLEVRWAERVQRLFPDTSH